MDAQTKINPNIDKTAINPELCRATAINPHLVTQAPGKISVGAIFAKKYEIVGQLGVSTGEADLYICQCDTNKYVLKLYRRKNAIKSEVVSVLKSIQCPYVAPILETGEFNGLLFDILPYYKNGSLQGKIFSLDQLKSMVIPCVNQALHVLHQNGIIHKDLKPSNIMLSDDQKSVAIIDFGISSVVEQGNTVLVTKTGMTPEYSAPETFRNLFLEESDYYSFGITLYELFCGQTPYKNMDAEEIAQFTAVQRIPFPKEMPKELQDLISAMTYFDITNRHEKKNPNRRWTYTEVLNWCVGKEQVVPGEGTDQAITGTIPVYTFMGQSYQDIHSLVVALASNWKEGKKQLYRGLMSAFFKSFNPEIAGYCLDAEEEASQSEGREDVVFWNLLYRIDPDLKEFYWMGREFESLSALGQDMLERLWKGDQSNYSYWDSILQYNILTSYLKKIDSTVLEFCDAATALEISHKLNNKSKRDTLLNYYMMSYLLSGNKTLSIEEKKIKSISELSAYLKELLGLSYQKFEQCCHSLMEYNGTLNVQLEAWLISQGKRKELDEWKRMSK